MSHGLTNPEVDRSIKTVELKATVPFSRMGALGRELDIDPISAQPRQVYFFDTPGLELSQRGVVLRARRTQGNARDCTVKLRPVVPGDIPKSLHRREDFKVEMDMVGDRSVVSASFTAALTPGDVITAVRDTTRLRKMYTREQRQFLAEFGGVEIPWDRLAVMGPVFVLKLKHAMPGYDYRVCGELWRYPDDSAIVEVSMKAERKRLDVLMKEWNALLFRLAVDLNDAQQTKTNRALSYFAARHQPVVEPDTEARSEASTAMAPALA